MRIFRPFLIRTIVFLSIIFLSSIAAKAQVAPDYLFLEVLDTNQTPVTNAIVKSEHSLSNKSVRTLTTDDQGTTGFISAGTLTAFGRDLCFRSPRKAFLHFTTWGFLSLEDRPHLDRETARIELLKIPQTKKERRILGDEQLKREFLWAAKTGDAAGLQKLLKSGISPNLNSNDLRGIPGPKNIPAIVLAANSADSATVEMLLKAGVKIDTKDEPFHSILITYLEADPFFWHKFKNEEERREILRQYEQGVDILIKAGADIKALNVNKMSALTIAAYKGYPQAVRLLLDKCFSPNTVDDRGATVLMYAADGDYQKNVSKIETVNLLLKAGADPNFSKSDCSSPLLPAAFRGDVEVLKALTANGAKIGLKCGAGQNPLFKAVEAGKIDAAGFLIDAGADLSMFGYNNQNLLMIAAEKGNEEMVKMLLAKGLSVKADRSGGSATLISAISGTADPNRQLIARLLKAGADPNVITGENKDLDICSTPLLLAIGNRLTNVMRLLVANGANVNLACGNGDTALVYAIRQHEPEVVKCLIELGADAEGPRIDRAIDLIKTFYKEGDYERQFIDETIKIINEARARKK